MRYRLVVEIDLNDERVSKLDALRAADEFIPTLSRRNGAAAVLRYTKDLDNPSTNVYTT